MMLWSAPGAAVSVHVTVVVLIAVIVLSQSAKSESYCPAMSPLVRAAPLLLPTLSPKNECKFHWSMLVPLSLAIPNDKNE